MPDAIRFSRSAALVGARHRDVGHLDRLQRDGGPADHAFPLADPRRAPRFGEGAAGLGRRPLDELLGALVVLEDHAAVQPRQLDGPRHDRGQHRLEIERGADRAADLAQRRELLDRARQLLRPRLQLLEQADVLDGDDGLVGEGLEQRDLLVGERLHFAGATPRWRRWRVRRGAWAPRGWSERRGRAPARPETADPSRDPLPARLAVPEWPAP